MFDIQNIYNELLKDISKENIILNEPMCKHTSFKIGGNADIYIKAKSIDDIKSVLKIVNEYNIPLFVFGNGTNLLVKDEGIRGIVLKIELDNIECYSEDGSYFVKVCAGVKNAVLSKYLEDNSITGFEFASGIPGTIGGAIKMNAGAYDGEVKDIVKNVTYIDYNGNIHTLGNVQCEFSYRKSIFSSLKGIILECTLELKKGNKEDIKKKINEYAKLRKEKQPLNYPNAGSTFKRGEDFITAKLIDECGLKGYCIGDAMVSDKHAGFIVNKANASYYDVIKLIDFVKKQVYDKFGKVIDLEVEIV